MCTRKRWKAEYNLIDNHSVLHFMSYEKLRGLGLKWFQWFQTRFIYSDVNYVHFYIWLCLEFLYFNGSSTYYELYWASIVHLVHYITNSFRTIFMKKNTLCSYICCSFIDWLYNSHLSVCEIMFRHILWNNKYVVPLASLMVFSVEVTYSLTWTDCKHTMLVEHLSKVLRVLSKEILIFASWKMFW